MVPWRNVELDELVHSTTRPHSWPVKKNDCSVRGVVSAVRTLVTWPPRARVPAASRHGDRFFPPLPSPPAWLAPEVRTCMLHNLNHMRQLYDHAHQRHLLCSAPLPLGNACPACASRSRTYRRGVTGLMLLSASPIKLCRGRSGGLNLRTTPDPSRSESSPLRRQPRLVPRPQAAGRAGKRALGSGSEVRVDVCSLSQ